MLQKYNKKVRRNLHTCFLCFTFAAVREQKILVPIKPFGFVGTNRCKWLVMSGEFLWLRVEMLVGYAGRHTCVLKLAYQSLERKTARKRTVLF